MVGTVFPARSLAEIRPSVIGVAKVDVVDFSRWPRSNHEKMSEPRCFILAPINTNFPITLVSDWASERTNFPREVCEQALAHTIKDKTEAAYRRGDLLDKRRELMAAWAEFATNSAGITAVAAG